MTQCPDWAIETEHLCKWHKGATQAAVRDLSLKIPRGICLSLLGPNGAGKSTTLEMLQGLTQPTHGTLRLFGRSWQTHSRELRAQLGGLLQENAFPARTRVGEALDLFASLYPQPADASLLLKRLGLENHTKRELRALSGGERQRAFLALALVGRPLLLFLDEPTTGLDPGSRRQLWALLEELKADGMTLVLTTHSMEEAERLSDRVAILHKGQLLVEGAPAELIETWAAGHTHTPRIQRASLEDVFLSLTGQSLIEEGV